MQESATFSDAPQIANNRQIVFQRTINATTLPNGMMSPCQMNPTPNSFAVNPMSYWQPQPN